MAIAFLLLIENGDRSLVICGEKVRSLLELFNVGSYYCHASRRGTTLNGNIVTNSF
ncbi:MAG: hypothetical protein ACRC6M_12390 [Microcystaceae cyanobacterium]